MDHREHIEQGLAEGEQLILLTDSDLDRAGIFGKQWIAVTSERILIYDGDAARMNGPHTALKLKDIKSVKSSRSVGQMAIVAESGPKRVELLRCTNSLAERFAAVVKGLDDTCKNGKPLEFFGLEEEELRYCGECGRLLPERGSFCPACLKKHEVLFRFWRYIKPHRWRALIVGSTILLGTGIGLVEPYLVGILVDDVLNGHGGIPLLTMIVGGIVGLHLAGACIEVVRGRTAAWLGSQIMHDVRLDLYKAIQGLTLKRYDKTQTGSLLSRLSGDTNMLNDAFIFVGFMALPALLQLIAICVILLCMDWRLGLLVLLPAPAVVGLTYFFFRKLHRYYYQWWQRSARMSSLANDCISGMRVVKAFSRESHEALRFRDRSYALNQAWFNCDGLWATGMPLIAFVATFGIYFVWYFGGVAVLKGVHGVTIGTLMSFIFYLGMFYGPLQMLTRVTDFINRAFTAAQRLFEIMDTDQEVYEDPACKPLDDIKGAFTFENVHFGYVPDKPVLKGVSVSINPGEMIGLAGKSGVGKTTLINLICRFYDVSDGCITLDGVDLRNIRLRDLRRRIGIVPQEPYLFNGTIYDNIAYGNPDAAKTEVIKAAMAANAHGFIMRQPDGYDTIVGERGAQLSGGERQRVSIARALLHDPRVLILDEATSSVDTETEELVQQALTRLVQGRTTFAIAHRLSTLRNASRLIVLDEGKVAEFGSHEELMAKKGIYHGLVEMQSKLSAVTAVGG